MPISYVTSGAWGAGTGVPHTANGADSIIYDLVQQIDAVAAVAPVGIADITQDGSTISIVLTDATVLGPFTLPRPVQRPTTTVTVSVTTLTPTGPQAMSYFRCTHASGCTISIEDNADVAIDTEWHFMQRGGPLSFIEDDNTDFPVTINPVDDKLFLTEKVGAVVTVKKVAAGSFDIFGGLADDVTA